MNNLHYEAYLSIAGPTHIYLKGRLLRGRQMRYDQADGYLWSLAKSLRKSLSRELKHSPVVVNYGGTETLATTDEEGYLDLVLPRVSGHSLDVELTIRRRRQQSVLNMAVTDYSAASHIVVSDIDDTLLVTGVRSFLKTRLAFNSVLVNPFRRVAIAAAADYLHQLKSHPATIMFYLSNSPWNWRSYLATFLQHRGFPDGYLLLRDFGLHLLTKKDVHQLSKYRELKRLLLLFPSCRFTLIGDTAEKDFDIYREMLASYPDQIDKIVLRRVGNPDLEDRIDRFIAGDTDGSRIEMISSFAVEEA